VGERGRRGVEDLLNLIVVLLGQLDLPPKLWTGLSCL
jgi:hypothetical protein